MGFSTAGAGLVLFIGILFMTSVVANGLFEAQRGVSRALDEDRDRAEFQRHTSVSVRDGDHGSGFLHLNLTNDGDTVLDANSVGLLLDGDWATGSITVREVDGDTVGNWAPGQILYLKTTAASGPARAYVVTETGHGALWTP